MKLFSLEYQKVKMLLLSRENILRHLESVNKAASLNRISEVIYFKKNKKLFNHLVI